MQNQNQNRSQELNQGEQLSNMLNNTTQVNNLQVVKYNKGEVKIDELNQDTNISRFEEDFSWLVDLEGKPIDFNQKITLYNGVKLMSHLLEKKYGMDKNGISEVKLSEFLGVFINEKEVTVLDLFNHVNNLYYKDKDSFNKIVEEVTTEHVEVPTAHPDKEDVIKKFLEIWKSDKPLGEIGETSINEVVVGLKNLDWDLVYNNTKLTVNAIPVATNAIGYSIIMKTYKTLYHDIPCPKNYDNAQKIKWELTKRRHFFAFAVVGAPLILYTLRLYSIGLKDMITVSVTGNGSSEAQTSSSSKFLASGLSLLPKIPNWVKLLFKLFFISLLLLKIFGVSSIFDIIYNVYYLKIFIISYSTIVILYLILNIYLIYLFYKKNIHIPEVLPEFIINWLKEFKVISSSKEGVHGFKNMYYREILLYLVIIAIVILIS